MFQPNKPMMNQGQAPAAAQPPQGAPAGMPPGGPAPPQQSGLRPVANIGFNQDVQNILLSRIQTLNPQEEKILDSALTPQTIPIFLKLFPELKPLFDMMTSGNQSGPIGQQPGQPGAGAPSPAAPGGAPAPAGAPGQGGAPDDSDDEDETDNPLVNNQASSGLVG